MKRKKILAISIVCVLLVGGGSVGGAAYYKKSKNEKRVVNVTPVVNMMGYDYGSETKCHAGEKSSCAVGSCEKGRQGKSRNAADCL